MIEIFTVGHSTASIEKFHGLIKAHQITAIADVRSRPYSRFPQFNRAPLQQALARENVSYVFLGNELGARPADQSIYESGKVSWARLAKSPLFNVGLERVMSGSQRYRIALLCAEHDPLTCHRAVLVARYLQERGACIQHILANGLLESHEQLENRLLGNWSLTKPDLFRSRQELLTDAYLRQEKRIAWQDDEEQKPANRSAVRIRRSA